MLARLPVDLMCYVLQLMCYVLSLLLPPAFGAPALGIRTQESPRLSHEYVQQGAKCKCVQGAGQRYDIVWHAKVGVWKFNHESSSVKIQSWLARGGEQAHRSARYIKCTIRIWWKLFELHEGEIELHFYYDAVVW